MIAQFLIACIIFHGFMALIWSTKTTLNFTIKAVHVCLAVFAAILFANNQYGINGFTFTNDHSPVMTFLAPKK